jgi:hypothetical protein
MLDNPHRGRKCWGWSRIPGMRRHRPLGVYVSCDELMLWAWARFI